MIFARIETYILLLNLYFPLFLLVSLADAQLNAPSFRLKNHTLSVSSQSPSKSPRFNITAGIEGRTETLVFDLENNNDIAPIDSYVQHLDVHGSVRHAEPLAASTYAITKGTMWMQDASHQSRSKVGWARIIIPQGGENPLFEGTLSIMSEEYEIRIQPSNDDSAQVQLVAHLTSAAGSANASFNELQLQASTCKTTPASSPYKRQDSWSDYSLADSIGSTYGCPDSIQIAYIGVATDCTYTAYFNSTAAVQRRILNIVNTAAVVLENSFNITLGLRNVTISEAACPSSTSSASQWNAECSRGDLDWRLQQFSSWRSSINDNNAYWSLLTGCNGTSGRAGVAWIGELCHGYGRSPSDVGANIVAGTSTEWQVFAHESAHILGAIHDCDSSACASGADGSDNCCPLSAATCDADSQYLMNPTVGQGMTRFSECTIGSVCSKIGRGDVSTYCLASANSADSRNGTIIINDSICGNGVVEAGEDCDCGKDSLNCSDDEAQCCDPMTCQWKGGNHCDRVAGKNNGQDNGDSSWVSRHLALVIGLSAGIGGALVLAALLTTVVCCYRRQKKKKRAQANLMRLQVDKRIDEAGVS